MVCFAVFWPLSLPAFHTSLYAYQTDIDKHTAPIADSVEEASLVCNFQYKLSIGTMAAQVNTLQIFAPTCAGQAMRCCHMLCKTNAK